jgi:hypothetical protein
VEEPDILVLKTEYNLAWNYFSAKELGDSIMNYWREWLNRLDSGKFDTEYPPPLTNDYGDIKGQPDWFGECPDGTIVFGYNLRNTNIFNQRVITSCKRTVNLSNYTNLWKKVILEHLDEQVTRLETEETKQDTVTAPLHSTQSVNDRETVILEDDEMDVGPRHHRRDRSPVADQWKTGASSWGHGGLGF